MANSIFRSPLTTEKLTPAAGAELLASQRLSRPISPHLAIYDIQQTWFGGSIWTRITGSAYSGALYVFGAAYLIAPLTGWHLESASLAAAFGALPLALKGGLKFLMAWPFVFHCVNGTRHLFYDMGKGFAKAQIRPIGWAIWGASLIASLGLAFY